MPAAEVRDATWTEVDEAAYQELCEKQAAQLLAMPVVEGLPSVEEIAGVITEDPDVFKEDGEFEVEILPLGERVLVELMPEINTSTIVIPEGVSTSATDARHAIVVAVGPDVNDRVAPGDVVFLPKGSKVGDWLGKQLLLPIGHIGAIIRQK